MLHINEDVAFGVQTVPGDGALFIPLPCLSQVCSMHSILKNGKLDAAWKKKKITEKELFDQMNLTLLLRSN